MSFSIKSFVQEFLCEPAESAVGDIDHKHIAHNLPAVSRRNPCSTVIEVISLDELQFPALHSGVHYWRQLCGERRFPRREDLRPRGIAGLLCNTELVRVLDGGSDYEYRIVGDAVACAYGRQLQNHRLSDFEATAPATVRVTRKLFGIVIDNGMPLAVRSKTGHDTPEAKFTEAETVILPLGICDSAVDHVLVFSCYLLDSAVP